MNDSAGAFVPAGIGGLDGYAEAFTALRKISGVVPSIMCMFGFNAGGGSYLPRQGSFMIQPADTFFGLTGPGVVKSVLGEDVTPDDLGGPKVHGASGVADLTVADEVAALRTAQRLLSYLPELEPRRAAVSSAPATPIDRRTTEIDTLLRKAFNSPTGFNTPLDVVDPHRAGLRPRRLLRAAARPRPQRDHRLRPPRRPRRRLRRQQQRRRQRPDRRRRRLQDRPLRALLLASTTSPVIFIEDTTGFLPGRDQESRGIVQAGRAMLDAIIDLRTPRILLILRNAFGGAYAAFNCYATGADIVLALPTTRVAVMGTGRQGVRLQGRAAARCAPRPRKQRKAGARRRPRCAEWLKAQEAELNQRYERELMNPREALSLGSISEIVMPTDLRRVLGHNLAFLLRHYAPGPMVEPQREFH